MLGASERGTEHQRGRVSEGEGVRGGGCQRGRVSEGEGVRGGGCQRGGERPRALGVREGGRGDWK